jgi:hypothetical protein
VTPFGPARGAFVISLDFELHWGLRHHGPVAGTLRERLLGTRAIVPRLLSLFEDHQVSATWAVVGFLFASSREELEAHLPVLRPQYRHRGLDPYREQLGAHEEDDPFHYGASLVTEIAEHPGQEIASHTFSHYLCLEEGQDETSFRADLEAACRIAEARGVTLRSLVLPSNQLNPAYLPVVKEAGFVAYRGNQRGRLYRPAQKGAESVLRRMARGADCYLPLERSPLQDWREVMVEPGLCNIAASRFLRPYSSSLSRLEPARLGRITSELEMAARRGRIFHLWWHPHNFGLDPEENLEFLGRVLSKFDELRARFGMSSLTMGEVADQAMSAGVSAELS